MRNLQLDGFEFNTKEALNTVTPLHLPNKAMIANSHQQHMPLCVLHANSYHQHIPQTDNHSIRHDGTRYTHLQEINGVDVVLAGGVF